MNFKPRDIFLAVLCAFLGSVKGYLVTLVKTLGAVEIFGIRSLGAACFILPIVIYCRYRILYDKKRNVTLFLRSVIGNIAVCGYYFGFVYLPISEASLLYYSTPLFTIFIGHFYLKEQCGFTEILSTILSICGVCAVCVPHFSGIYSTSARIGVAGSLIGAFAQAVALAIIRKITEIPPFVVSFWWAVVGVLFSSALTGAAVNDVKIWECGWESAYLVSIVVVGFVSEVSLVSALKSTDAIIVSLALTSEIVWAFLLQYFVCHEVPDTMTIIGGVIIVGSLVLHPLVKFISQRDTGDC